MSCHSRRVAKLVCAFWTVAASKGANFDPILPTCDHRSKTLPKTFGRKLCSPISTQLHVRVSAPDDSVGAAIADVAADVY